MHVWISTKKRDNTFTVFRNLYVLKSSYMTNVHQICMLQNNQMDCLYYVLIPQSHQCFLNTTTTNFMENKVYKVAQASKRDRLT